MRITLNIEKRYAFVIIGLLTLIVGILAVTASTYINPVSKTGHDISELGSGIFNVGEYIFQQGSPVHFQDILVVGTWAGGTLPGRIYMWGQTGDPLLLISNQKGNFRIDNAVLGTLFTINAQDASIILPGTTAAQALALDNVDGDFRIYNTAGKEIFKAKNNGDLCFNGNCKSSWPAQNLEAQWFNCPTSLCNSITTCSTKNCCPSGWTNTYIIDDNDGSHNFPEDDNSGLPPQQLCLRLSN